MDEYFEYYLYSDEATITLRHFLNDGHVQMVSDFVRPMGTEELAQFINDCGFTLIQCTCCENQPEKPKLRLIKKED